jgi:hypothetical protein
MNFKQIIYKSVVVISLLLLNLGCTSGELDFDQVNNFETKPIYKVYVNDFIPAKTFTISQFSTTLNSIAEEYPIKTFENSLFENTLSKAELNFIISSKISSQLIIDIELIDKNGNEIDKFNRIVPAYTGVDFFQNIIRTYDTQNQIASLKNIDKVKVIITCNNITVTSTQSFSINSRLIAYIKP